MGDDFNLNMLGDANVIAQWDKAGNAIGYNNGFDFNGLLSAAI